MTEKSLAEVLACLRKDVEAGDNAKVELAKTGWKSDDDAWEESGPAGVTHWFTAHCRMSNGRLAGALINIVESPGCPSALIEKIRLELQ